MLVFRLLTAIWVTSLISSFYIPFTLPQQILFLLFVTSVYGGICGWGSYQIRSQLYLKAYCQNTFSQDKIAITFDDGPDPAKTPRLLDILKKYGAKATFFMIGSKVRQYPELTKQVHESGHAIGNHSFCHGNRFPMFPPKQILKDINLTQQIITNATGDSPGYFRPPFGVTNPLIGHAVRQTNLKTIGWSLRSLDTRIKDKQAVVDKVLRQVKPGDVILLHDTTPDVEWILEEILIQFRNKNLKPVTVEELLFTN